MLVNYYFELKKVKGQTSSYGKWDVHRSDPASLFGQAKSLGLRLFWLKSV